MLPRITAAGIIVGLILAMGPVGCDSGRQDAHSPPPSIPPPPIPPAPIPPPSVPAPATAGKLIIRSTMPVRWSAKSDPEERRAILAGRRRLAISVKAYEPPTSGPSTLVVHLVSEDGTKRQEVHRFGVHPNAPFRAKGRVPPQRFLVSLADHADLLGQPEVRLEVGFDSSRKPVEGGMVELSMEFVDL